jgi:capsular polysaccharide transport system permease protein
MNVDVDQPSIRSTLPGWHKRRRRHRSFLAWVVAPTLLTLAYLLLFAQPQYASEFRFAVYTQGSGSVQTASATTDSIAVDLPSSPAVQASFIVTDYLQSSQVIEDLRKRFNLPALYKGRGFDPVFHFWWDNGSFEAMLTYWRNFVVDVNFDITTGLGNVSVRAFSPQDALRLAQALVELSERVVNDVSMRPRLDAVAFARAGLDRAEKALDDVFKEMEAFRFREGTAGPARNADAAAALTASLQSTLAGLNAQAASLQTRLAPTAPSLVALRAQIAATEQEITRTSAQLREPLPGVAPEGSPNLSNAMRTYAFLQQQSQFAQSFRDTMARNLEQARFSAEVQRDYMQVSVHPLLAQATTAPKPIRWTAVTFIALSAFWMAGVLLVAALRDHTV